MRAVEAEEVVAAPTEEILWGGQGEGDFALCLLLWEAEVWRAACEIVHDGSALGVLGILGCWDSGDEGLELGLQGGEDDGCVLLFFIILFSLCKLSLASCEMSVRVAVLRCWDYHVVLAEGVNGKYGCDEGAEIMAGGVIGDCSRR